MEKLIEVAESEVVIEFQPGVKCRAKIHLRSLHPTSPVTFKVQTSSPNKFLVSPPTGLLSPLSTASFQVILRPQSHPPSSFPRSPSDRFLIKVSTDPSFSSGPHQDTKLRVVYVGPFLLLHAVSRSNLDAAKHILRRQKSLLPRLSPDDSASLLLSASTCPDPTFLNLLLDAGLRVPTTTASAISATASGGGSFKTGEVVATSKGWTPLHFAAASDDYDAIPGLIEESGGGDGLDRRDTEGRTALHLATGKGYMRCVRLLIERGADKDARSNDGRTALHRAVGNGDAEMVALLLELGADACIATGRGRSPLDLAREKGHQEVVELLERGELILTAARRGDLKRLHSLLKQRVGINCHDQYGVTALHAAAIKGYRDVVSLLVESGMDMECQDMEGHTPLHLAVEGGCLDTVEALIDMGANVNARSKRGASPLYMAMSMGYESISQLLLTRGASSSSMASPSSSLSSLSCN